MVFIGEINTDKAEISEYEPDIGRVLGMQGDEIESKKRLDLIKRRTVGDLEGMEAELY